MKIQKRYYIFVFVIALFLVSALVFWDSQGSRFEIIEADGAVVTESTEPVCSSRVNINTAGKGQLMMIKGIGDRMSENIIEYREKNGDFETVQDIMKVSGIGYETYQKLEDYITVR